MRIEKLEKGVIKGVITPARKQEENVFSKVHKLKNIRSLESLNRPALFVFRSL